MHSKAFFPCATDEFDQLRRLLTPVDKNLFRGSINRLNILFTIYADTCPVPLPASGLIITPEIRAQSERYLPIANIASVFNHLYSSVLAYTPNFSSTPFNNTLSWADTYSSLPQQFQVSPNPARLLESLLGDTGQLTRFLFASFLPNRFYGGIGRYPGQQKYIREWLTTRKTGRLHCLDAACGAGDEAYGLALLLLEHGFSSDEFQIDGWTLEPLEVWAAIHRRFPHDRHREGLLREATLILFQRGYDQCINFHCQDILMSPSQSLLIRKHIDCQADEYYLFDLILCNGLLGGPIIHELKTLDTAVGNLAQLLAPGGILLAANNFHGGWKQKCPQTELRAFFEKYGLKYIDTEEGVGGLKPD
jgi:chemotaxis methyl-accepting protein methylase